MSHNPTPELLDRRNRLTSSRFYAILDTGYVPLNRAVEVTEHLVQGGVDLIQLRAKKESPSQINALAARLRAVIPPGGPLFILNDHPDLVSDCGADGVHVGQDDLRVQAARLLAGDDCLVGKSTHSLAQAESAQNDLPDDIPDYIGVGPIFATPTKTDYAPVGLELIAQVRAAVTLPQFCIGGIKEENLAQVLQAGARRVVIVSALLLSADIAAYCRRVQKQLADYPLDSPSSPLS